MATTTNFNWSTPDDTSLVKDGAAAIRTLGQSIDTSMAELKGGTTGQVLSKTSNTDMDFTWVAQDDSNAIQNAIVDAKGDLIAATANDTPARLAVGNNGETLVADSSTATGLRYQGNFAAGKNKIINGDMNIWQRGTSYTVGNAGPYYGAADRWRYYHNGATAGTNTVSRQAFTVGQTDVPNNPTYFQRWTATTVAGSQTVCDFDQLIEDVSTFAGQTVNASIYLKSSGTFTYTIYLEQNFGSGGSGSVATTVATGSTTTGWVRAGGSVTLPSITGKTVGTGSSLRFLVRFSSPTSGATFDISNGQVEAGSVATAFQTATGTIQGELAACQRYYWRAGGSEVYETVSELGIGTSTTQAYVEVSVPQMRIRPSAVEYSTLELVIPATATYVISALTLAGTESGKSKVMITITTTGITQYRPYMVRTSNSTSGYLAFTAEL